VGLAATSRFLRQVGSFFQLEGPAGRVVAAECDRVRERLSSFVSRVLAGRGALVIADPWTANGLCCALRELGMDVPLAAVLRRTDGDDVVAELRRNATDVWFDPEYARLEEWLRERVAQRQCDVVIGSALLRDAAARAAVPYVEVTAPHYLEHFALPTPYMGFNGFMRLAERLAKAISELDYQRGFSSRS
jgi:nitrogenase molybdenum-iron protein alpha/beta subunit